MFKLAFFFTVTGFLFASEPDFGKFNGTGIILDLNSSERIIFGSRANERLSPCSTYKILNTMIALDSKAIQDENEILPWDGTVREYTVWNKDHSMRSAISVSAVWFYQEMARRIGKTRMQQALKQVNYGNADMSNSITEFWLSNGSLKISANEQIDFLASLMRNQLPFTSPTVSILKDIMTLEKKQNYTLAGKTGSCGGVGWFVGFIELNHATKVFAFNIKGNGASGAEAKRIAIDYLKKL